MAKERIKKENLEVIEEIVDDFEYLYEEEEEIIRNRATIRKYKCFGFLIVIATLILLVFGTGVATMLFYDTDKVVTSELREKHAYLTNTEPFYDDVINYVVQTELKDENGISYDVSFSGEMGSFYEKLEENDILKGNDLLQLRKKVNTDYSITALDEAIKNVENIKVIDEGLYKEYHNLIISSLKEIKMLTNIISEARLENGLSYDDVKINLEEYSTKTDELIKLQKEIKTEFNS